MMLGIRRYRGLSIAVSLCCFVFLWRHANARKGVFKKKKKVQQQYTFQDDVSWAVTHADRLQSAYHQDLYDSFMDRCITAFPSCQFGEDVRLKMNNAQPACVHNFTKMGFEKIKAPAALWELLSSFWELNKDQEVNEWGKQVTSYHNHWESPPNFVSIENASLAGGGPEMQKKVWEAARPVLEEWTGQRLVPVSAYGIRIYKNNSILAPHVDRMPLITSAIINMDQDIDEPWPLEVFDHDGNAHNVTMDPGDMVLYESHSTIHGRPFPLKGRMFANVFVHFEAIGPLGDDNIDESGSHGNGIPPYIIRGCSWEDAWKKDHPDGWDLEKKLDNPSALVRKGDIRGLEYMAYKTPELITRKDYNGWAPVHEAAYLGYLDVVETLLENGATLRDRTNTGHSVYDLVTQSPLGAENPVAAYIEDQLEL